MAHMDLDTTTYEAAERRLHGRDSVRIGHNTVLHRASTEAIAVRYHATDIVTVTEDGWAILDTRGWHTVTTWSRINALLPSGWTVWSKRGLRHLYFGGQPVARYLDGIAVNVYSGAVGIRKDRWTYTVGVILSPEAVTEAVAEGKAAAEARSAKRDARLAAQHDGEVDIAEVRRFGDRIAEAYEAGREPLALHTETFALYTSSPHGRSRAWDCPQCIERRNVATEYRERILAATHDLAVKYVGVVSPPSMLEVRRLAQTVGEPWSLLIRSGHVGEDYRASARVIGGHLAKVSCPWDCPKRVGTSW